MVTKVLLLSFLVFGITVAEQLCPAGWTGPTNSGKCYQILHASTSAIDAEKLCQDHGGSLGNIKNQIEQDFLNTYVLPDAKDWVITGLTRIPAGNTGTWTWADRTAAGYTNWGSKIGDGGHDSNLNNYMYLYSLPSHKGTANYGKWYQDTAESREVLCEVVPRNKDNRNCGSYGQCGQSCGCRC